jgi:hypothetical protein
MARQAEAIGAEFTLVRPEKRRSAACVRELHERHGQRSEEGTWATR